MFAKVSNASKFGFISLVHNLKEQGYTLIDCQQETPHLASLGAVPIPRSVFLEMMDVNNKREHKPAKWTNLFSPII